MNVYRRLMTACVTILAVQCFFAALVTAQSETPRLGGAEQVDNRIDLDRIIQRPMFGLSFLDPYFEFKDTLKEQNWNWVWSRLHICLFLYQFEDWRKGRRIRHSQTVRLY